MDDSKTFVRLANSIFIPLRQLTTLTENWGYFFFHPPFSEAIDLQTKIRIIYITSMFDIVEAACNKLPKSIQEAHQLGFLNLEKNGEEIKKIVSHMGKVLEKLSRDEQLFINNLRNQFVHGYLTAGINDAVGIKFVKDGVLYTEQMNSVEYNKIIEGFFTNGHSLDKTVEKMLQPFFDIKSQHWRYLGYIQQSHLAIYQAILEDKKIKIDI